MADIAFTGKLADEPEVIPMPNGSQVTRLRVIENRGRRDPRTGEWKDLTPNTFSVQVWGALGENAATSLHKGQSVNVTGRIATNRWPDKETGKPHTSQTVVAETVGPDLKWQTVTVTKAPKKSPGASGVAGATDDGAPDEPQKQLRPFAREPEAQPTSRSLFTSSVPSSEGREDEEPEP